MLGRVVTAILFLAASLGLGACAHVARAQPQAEPSPAVTPSHSPAPSPSVSASPHRKAKKTSPLDEVEEKYAQAGTLEADFTQTNEVSATGQKKVSSGKIYVKKPYQVRWETLKPDKNLLVSDGTTFWFYTPPFDPDDTGQLIVRKASEVQSALATAILAGSISHQKGLSIQKLTPDHYVIVPKRGSAGTVTRAEIEINPDKHLIDRVILMNEGGNTSDIQLSNIELGKPLGEDLFHFKAPPNTERVH